MTPLSERQLNRATLARQLLLEREPIGVIDAVRRVVALQAQEPASPYVALWNRVDGFDPSNLDAAFADGALVKATLVRITLHVVHADDYTAFHEAMADHLRQARVYDRRFTSTGLTADVADAVIEPLVEFASEPRTKDEIEAMFAEHLGAAPDPRLWWAIKTFAPLVHVPGGGPWSFNRVRAFRAGPDQPPRAGFQPSLQHLIRRYLEGFGPASLLDFAQFSMQKRPGIREALAAMSDRLVTYEGPDGAELYDVPDAPVPDGDTPAPPRLLGMWDSALLAYADRRRIVPDEHRKAVIQRNGDVLPTLLVDGLVRGVWRLTDDGIEATAFEPLSDDAWDGLAAEAQDLATMLRARDPAVYRRYHRWWTSLPAVETRLLTT